MSQPQIQNVPPPDTQLPTSGLGVASMVVGIIGLVFFWMPILGQILNIIAIAFGGVGVYQVRRKTRSGMGMAIAGLVLGVIGLALFAVMIIVTLSMFNL